MSAWPGRTHPPLPRRPRGHNMTEWALRLTREPYGQSGQGKWPFGQNTSCHRVASLSWGRAAQQEHRLGRGGLFCLSGRLPGYQKPHGHPLLACSESDHGLPTPTIRGLWAGKPRAGTMSQA